MTIRQNGGVFGRHPEFQTATVKGDLLLGTALQFVGGARITSTSAVLTVDKNMSVNGLTLGSDPAGASFTNVVFGTSGLPQSTYTGTNSTAVGWGTLFSSTGNSYYNTAIGSGALFSNTSGYVNTAVGGDAGRGNTSGANNTFVGGRAGGITTGSNNIVIGAGATASSRTVSNETTIGNSSTTKARIFGTLTLASTGITWSACAGSPEGAVTAQPGSIYSDTNGGSGATLYVKESGTGNTGWIAK
jgi:hypothetical protein